MQLLTTIACNQHLLIIIADLFYRLFPTDSSKTLNIFTSVH